MNSSEVDATKAREEFETAVEKLLAHGNTLTTAVNTIRRKHKDAIAQFIIDNPTISYEKTARRFNVSTVFVLRLVTARGLGRKQKKEASHA